MLTRRRQKELNKSVNSKKPKGKHIPNYAVRRSGRHSTSGNWDSNVFDFSTPSKEPGEKKKSKKALRKKAQVKAKLTFKSSILTTDPSFQVGSYLPSSSLRGQPALSITELDETSEEFPSGEGASHFQCDEADDYPGDNENYIIQSQSTVRPDEGCISRNKLLCISALPLSQELNAYGVPYASDTISFAKTISTPQRVPIINDFEGFPDVNVNPQSEQIENCFGFEENFNLNVSPVPGIRIGTHIIESGGFDSTLSDDIAHPTRYSFTRPPLRPIDRKIFNISNCQRESTDSLPFVTKRKIKVKSSVVADKENICHLNTKNANQQNESLLFDEQNVNEVPASLCNTCNIVSQQNDPCTKVVVLSPVKSFSKPARRSYDRRSLEKCRRNFQKKYFGFALSPANKRKEKSKPRKRKKSNPGKSKEMGTLESKDQPGGVGKNKKKKETCKNNNVDAEMSQENKLLESWASATASHFEDVDSFQLVVE